MNLNRGNWKRMENRWEKAAAEGNKVEVDIDVIYDVDSQRPKSFIVTETIDGVISDTSIRFINQAGR